MIDDIRIESEEDGFHLVLEGDHSEEVARWLNREEPLRLRLSQDAAIELFAQAQVNIAPWVTEMNYQRTAYERATLEEKAEVLGRQILDESSKRVEALLDKADTARKRGPLDRSRDIRRAGLGLEETK